MRRKCSVLMVVVLFINMMITPLFVNAQEEKTRVTSAVQREIGLKAEYYLLDLADLTLEEKTNEKIVETINYPKGNNNLGTELKNETGKDKYVGIRWTGKLIVPESAYYTFYSFTDDGSKLWINGEVAIDYWKVSWEEEQTSQKIYLEQGKEYEFRFDYMQYIGGQCATLSWSNDASMTTKTIIPKEAFLQPDAVIEEPVDLKTEFHGLQGQYYQLAPAGTTGKQDVVAFGQLMTTCVDESIYFDSMENVLSEQTGVRDKAGARWTSNLVAPKDGYYTFHVFSDNGAKISLDGKQILTWWVKEWDKWQNSKEVYLEKGEAHSFKFDYFEWDGGSHVKLFWSFREKQTDAAGEKEQVPGEAFYIPDSYEGAVVSSIDTSNAILNIDEGLSGTMDIKGSGFDEGKEIQVEVISSSGNSLTNRLLLTVTQIQKDCITVLVPSNLRVGRYRLKVTIGDFVSKTSGVNGIFSITTNNQSYSDRPEYPNPEWSRKDASGAGDNWLSLNGLWDFEFDTSEKGQSEGWYQVDQEFTKEINVPFCWESAYSGITDTSYLGQAWYQKEVTLKKSDWDGKQIILKFGAVDWKCKLWVNGKEVGEHEGGYTAFEMNITKYVKMDATNIITLWVEDKSSYGDNSYPALVGKQGLNAPCGYTHTSGIWQSVYLEGRKSVTSIEYAHANPDVEHSGVQFDLKINNAGTQQLTVQYDFKSILYDQTLGKDVDTGSSFQGEQTISMSSGESVVSLDMIKIENQMLWNYNQPNLYEGTITIKNASGTVLDHVATYFGQRNISTAYYSDKVGAKYIYVNNNPVYLSGLLDQGFFPEGIYTASSEEALKFDILEMRNLGFNMIRKHLKIEDPLQYYWADKLGMFIWQDMPHATAMCPSKTGDSTPGRVCYEYALEQMVNKNYNHPSVIAVMLFNETWGLQEAYFNNKQEVKAADGLNTLEWVKAMYDKVKEMNPNILVEDMSPCNQDHIQPSDMNTWHMYPKGYASSKDFVNSYVSNTYDGSKFNYKFGYQNDGDPFLNSEYGGVAAYDGDWDISWCFKYQTDIQRQYDKLSGFVYTEPYDVEYERNGILTYDRRAKEFGYDEIAYGGDMTIKDLIQEEYIGLDVDPAKVMKPGALYSAPVITMRWSPDTLTEQYQVKWRFDGTDIFGNNITTNRNGSFPIQFKPYTKESKNISFKLPSEECVGTVTVWIEDEKGQSIAKNFVNVIVSDGTSLIGTEQVDEDTVIIRNPVEDNSEVKTTGNVSFSYEIPVGFNLTNLNSLRILAEASSVKGATLNNSANAQTTKGSALPSDVTVSINGIEVDTVYLPDNPRDIRGTLTLPQGLNGGSSAGNYGYLINLDMTKEQLVAIKNTLTGNNQLVVSYEVKESAANPNGVRIYGDQTGRYAVNPTLILNPEDTRIEDISVNNEIKQIAEMEQNNYSVESTMDTDTSLIARYNGMDGYSVSLKENGEQLVLATLSGTVLADKKTLNSGEHPVKITLFDDHIKVYVDHNPEPVIDIYDYSKFIGNVAVQSYGSANLNEVVIAPESYHKVETVVNGQTDIQYVDHFNTESTFARRYELMGNEIQTTTKNGKLELTANMGDKVIINELAADDLVLEADVAVTNTIYDGNIGFVFRGSEWSIGADGAKGYYAGYGIDGENGFLNLGRMDGGSWKQLGRVTIGKEVYGTLHRLKVVAVGSRIRVYLDDETAPRIDVYDSTYASGGVALRGFKSTGSFDNVVVSTAPRYQADFENNRIDEWQTIGDWTIEHGKLVSAASGSAILVGNASWSDYQVSASITMEENTKEGIAVRSDMVNGSLVGYKVVLDQGTNTVSLLRNQKDQTESIIETRNYEFTPGTTYEVTVRAINHDLYVLIGGKRIIHREDNTFTRGKVGFVSNKEHSTFDNMVVSEKFLYEDDFSQGSLSGWNIIEGNFSVNDNTLFIPEGSGLKMVDGYATWDDYILSAKVKLAATKDQKSNAGFIFRASNFSPGIDNLRGYVAGVNYNANLSDVDGASGVELGDIHYGWRQIKNQKQVMENNRWYDLEVKAIDNKITVTLDGVVCYEVEDAAYQYGMFGIRNFQTAAYMKELKVVPYDLSGIIEDDPEELPDMEKPSTPTNLMATNVKETSATIIWNESSDNVGVIGYQVTLGNDLVQVVSGASITIDNLTEDTEYTASICAMDAAGNQSDPGVITFKTGKTGDPVDLDKPTSPTNVTVSNVTETTATLNWDESTDNVGVIGYQVTFDKISRVQVVSGASITMDGLVEGTEYTASITALDQAGNQSDPGIITFVTKDKIVPTDPTNPTDPTGPSNPTIPTLPTNPPKDDNLDRVVHEDENTKTVITTIVKQLSDLSKETKVEYVITNKKTNETTTITTISIQDKDGKLIHESVLTVKKDATGKELYSFQFDGADLKISERSITEFDLAMKLISPNALGEDSNILKLLLLDKKNAIGDSQILSFAKKGVLPASISCKVSVENNNSIKPGSTVYLYSYNEKTNQLEALPNNSYQVGTDGYVTLHIINGGDYVLLPNKPSSTIVNTLVNQIKVTINKQSPSKLTLYMNKIKGNTASIKISIPNTLLIVKTFSKQIMDQAIEEVKITYTTSDARIATISSSGKITGKKAGTVTVTTTILLRNGVKKIIKTKVKVMNK